MSEKLTLEWCFKYYNAKVGINDARFKVISISKETGKLKICEFENSLYNIEAYPIECQLILRPLSSLTDEEKKEIDMIQRKFSLRALADDNDETYRKHFQRITDKLREWNIDIDSLQERELCIYE